MSNCASMASLYDVLKINANGFARLMSSLSALESYIKSLSRQWPDADLNQPLEDASDFADHFKPLMGALDLMDLPFSSVSADRLKRKLESSDASFNGIRDEASVLRQRILDELNNRLFFGVESSKQSYFEDPKLLGDGVFNNLPSANQEITEAGTCLALDRGTIVVPRFQTRQ